MKLRLIIVIVVLASSSRVAFAEIEPILYSDGPIPGVMIEDPQNPGEFIPATIWQTGLYRPRSSPDGSRWAIRVNQSSAGSNEYIVAGSGTTGMTVIHSLNDDAMVPPTSIGVFYISERGLSINDAGVLALSGSDSAAATTDTIWLIETGTGATVVAQEDNAVFLRPGGLGEYKNIGGPTISNTNKIAFNETNVVGSDTQQAILWDAGTFSELAREGDTFVQVPGRQVQNLQVGEADAARGGVFYYENAGEDPVVAYLGDFDGTSSDDQFFVRRDESTLEFDVLATLAAGGISPDGRTLNAEPFGWVDALGNSYIVPFGGFTIPDMYAYINDTLVAEVGGLVGGNVADETWIAGAPVFLHSPVIALDQNSLGGYIIGGMTDNPETFDAGGTTVTKNQVIIYVAPDGTRTELVRNGDPFTVEVDGVPEVRRIVTLGQQDSTIASFVDDTHLYFLAGTEFFAGSIPDDLFARVPLPTSCVGDIVVDGAVNVSDLLELLAMWGSGGGPADLNQDDFVDVEDLLILLANWGPC
jgi:hypothetical protein